MWARRATLKNIWIDQRSARRRTFELRDQDTGAVPDGSRGVPCTPGMRRLAVECAWFGMRAAIIGTKAWLLGERADEPSAIRGTARRARRMGHLAPYDVIAARDPSATSAAASRAAILGRLTSGSGRVAAGFRGSVWRVETIRGWPLSRPTYGEFSRTLSCHLVAPEVRRSRPRAPSRTVLCFRASGCRPAVQPERSPSRARATTLTISTNSVMSSAPAYASACQASYGERAYWKITLGVKI